MKLPEYIGFRVQGDPAVTGAKLIPLDLSRLVFCRDCKFYLESEAFPGSRFCYRFFDEFGYNKGEEDFCSCGVRKSHSDD